MSRAAVLETVPILPPNPDGEFEKDCVPLKGGVNETEEKIKHNVKINIRRQLPQVKIFDVNNFNVAMACGGPSLKTHLKSLRRLVDKGYKLVTMNGTHDYLIEKGFRPSLHIQIDARDFNSRFLTNPQDYCKYFLASQCSPSSFDALAGHDDVWIYHCVGHTEEVQKILDDYYMTNYYKVSGGSTVTMNALMVLRMLGYQYFDIFGFDSCLLRGKHHSYAQVENDVDSVRSIWAKQARGEDKEFRCSLWMVHQAYDFLRFVRASPEGLFKCRVHGQGLIAHMMRTKWQMSLEEGLHEALKESKEQDNGSW